MSKPNQTKPNQAKPSQAKPSQAKPSQAKAGKSAQENLERQGYECYLPTFPKEKLLQSGVAIADEPLFPRCLFIRLGQGHTDQSWTPIRSTKGVSRLVRFGLNRAKVHDGLIDCLRATEAAVQANPEPLFTSGEQVRLTDGAFAGIEGVYRMADGDRRVVVLIELMGKPVVVKVDAASLQKVIYSDFRRQMNGVTGQIHRFVKNSS